MITAYYAVV